MGINEVWRAVSVTKARFQGPGRASLSLFFPPPPHPCVSPCLFSWDPCLLPLFPRPGSCTPHSPHPSTWPHASTLHSCKTQESHYFPADRPSSICCTFWDGGKEWNRAGLPDDGDWRMRLSAAIVPKGKAVSVTPASAGKGWFWCTCCCPTPWPLL